jgi:regulator of protease activity HflC (stomatin/prohibitin superfamily)
MAIGSAEGASRKGNREVSEFFKWLAEFLQKFKCWTVVQPWERGVRVRLGKAVKPLDPGPHFRVPLIDTIVLVNTRLRIVPFPMATVATPTGRTYSVAGSVGFSIDDPLASMMVLSHPEDGAAALVQAACARFVATADTDHITAEQIAGAAHVEVEKAIAGVSLKFVSVFVFTPVRPIRLLQDNWTAGTGFSSFTDHTK